MYLKVREKKTAEANTNELSMNKELIDNIIESDDNQFDESDRFWMEGTGVDVLEKMLPAASQRQVVYNDEGEEPLVAPAMNFGKEEVEEEEEVDGVENENKDAPLTVPKMNFEQEKK